MSRKSRHRKPIHRPAAASAKKAAAGADPAAQAKILAGMQGMANDGYSNAAAFLGADSPLMATGTFVPSGISSNIALLTTTYSDALQAYLLKSTLETSLAEYSRDVAQLYELWLLSHYELPQQYPHHK